MFDVARLSSVIVSKNMISLDEVIMIRDALQVVTPDSTEGDEVRTSILGKIESLVFWMSPVDPEGLDQALADMDQANKELTEANRKAFGI